MIYSFWKQARFCCISVYLAQHAGKVHIQQLGIDVLNGCHSALKVQGLYLYFEYLKANCEVCLWFSFLPLGLNTPFLNQN